MAAVVVGAVALATVLDTLQRADGGLLQLAGAEDLAGVSKGLR